jgi:hypothetical protein
MQANYSPQDGVHMDSKIRMIHTLLVGIYGNEATHFKVSLEFETGWIVLFSVGAKATKTKLHETAGEAIDEALTTVMEEFRQKMASLETKLERMKNLFFSAPE